MLLRLLAGPAVVAGLAFPALADDKLKTQAMDALNKSDVRDPRVLQTTHLVVATSLPEAKAKALGEALDKVYAQATRALKFDANELKGQMTVFVFTDLD